MDLEQAIELLKNAVKNNSTNDENHLDLTLIPIEDKPKYQKALVIAQLAIQEGKLTKEDFKHRIHLE